MHPIRLRPPPVFGNPKYVDPVPGFSGVYLLFREIDYWGFDKKYRRLAKVDSKLLVGLQVIKYEV